MRAGVRADRQPHPLLRRHPLLYGIALGLCCVLGLTSCEPLVEGQTYDDAGDAAFVRQAVPILLGRKVRGHAELKALGDVIAVTDRETLVRALASDEAFIAYWTAQIIDDLQVSREGFKNHARCYGPSLLTGAPTSALAEHVRDNPPDADFGADFNMTDLVRSALVLDNLYPIYRAHLFALADKPIPDFESPEPQRRKDLGETFEHIYLNRQRSCLLCHNSQHSVSGPGSGWNRTHPYPAELEKALWATSQGRSADETYAIFRTDVRSGPLKPWGIEGCGSFKNDVPDDIGDNGDILDAWFAGNQGSQASVRNLVDVLDQGYIGLQDGLDRSMDPATQSRCDFCAQPACASASPSASSSSLLALEQATKQIMLDNCYGCHVTNSAGNLMIFEDDPWYSDLLLVPGFTGELRVVPGDPDASYLIKKLEDDPSILGQRMPRPASADPLSASEIATVRDWIAAIDLSSACQVCDSLDCNPTYPPKVSGEEAAAFLLAMSVSERVWERSMGYPLTVANYFPRNDGQLSVLWNLSEYQLLPTDWSLESLLVRILTSELFNRKAPDSMSGSTPYELSIVYDPWVEADPREPPVSEPDYDPAENAERHHNAMSDGIYRYSAQNLLRSVHHALGWPAPVRRFSRPIGILDGTYGPHKQLYPDEGLRRALGEHFSEFETESSNADFVALLTWESRHGVCDGSFAKLTEDELDDLDDWKDLVYFDDLESYADWDDWLHRDHTGAADDLVDLEEFADHPTWIDWDDWIDRLMDAVEASTANPPLNPPLTVEEVVVVMRDWLLGDGTIASTAPQGLTASDTETQALEALLGVSLSEEATSVVGLEGKLRAVCGVMLQTPQFWLAGIVPEGIGPEPRLRVCMPGTPCSYQEICDDLSSTIGTLPEGTDLNCGASSVSVNTSSPLPFAGLCPPGTCISMPIMPGRIDQCLIDPSTCPPAPPSCDPRCTGLNCCGGPRPPEDHRGYLVSWLDGGRVLKATDVQVLRVGANAWSSLPVGSTVSTGDLVTLKPGSIIDIRGSNGTKLTTPPFGLAANDPIGKRLVMISGPEALPEERPLDESPEIDLQLLERKYRHGWWRWGEAGEPVSEEDRRGFMGFEQRRMSTATPTAGP